MKNIDTFKMRIGLCVMLFWLTTIGVGLCPTPSFAQTKEETYKVINEERLKRGLPAVEIDHSLARSAQSWAFFMPYKGKHNTNFISRRRAFKSQQKKEQIWGAEAIALGGDPVERWLKSYRHAGIVLGPKTKCMGLGYWKGKWVLRILTK